MSKENTTEFPEEIVIDCDLDFEGEVIDLTEDVFTEAYDKGKTDGVTEGYNNGREQGKQDERSTFWDNFQNGGERAVYNYAFGSGWNENNLKPKYIIKPTSAISMFANNDTISDLSYLNDYLDMSICKSVKSFIAGSKVKKLGVLDLRGATSLSSMFASALHLNTIETLIVSENCTNYSSCFSSAIVLNNITFEGTISVNIDFKSSPLTAESAKSAINCLANYAGTENEFKNSIQFSETTWGYLDSEGETASPDGNSWREYIMDLGWNF